MILLDSKIVVLDLQDFFFALYIRALFIWPPEKHKLAQQFGR